MQQESHLQNQQYLQQQHSQQQVQGQDPTTPRTQFNQEDALTLQDIDYAATAIHDALHRGFLKGQYPFLIKGPITELW